MIPKRIFPEITVSAERRYILAYWRYLLGWEKTVPPGTPSLSEGQRLRLRNIARRANLRTPSPGKVIAFTTTANTED